MYTDQHLSAIATSMRRMSDRERSLVLAQVNAPSPAMLAVKALRSQHKPTVIASTSSRPVNAKRDAHQATKKPSHGQWQMCDEFDKLLGNRRCTSLAAFRRINPTMLDASKLYYSLKDECAREGLI